MHKPVSPLIHAAAVLQPGFMTDFDLSSIDFHLNINAKACMLGSTLLGKEMKSSMTKATHSGMIRIARFHPTTKNKL